MDVPLIMISINWIPQPQLLHFIIWFQQNKTAELKHCITTTNCSHPTALKALHQLC